MNDSDKRREPAADDRLWYVTDTGDVAPFCRSADYDGSVEDIRMRVGNCYRTREDASAVAERVMAVYSERAAV